MKRSTITRISGGSVQSGGFRTFDLTILPKNEPNGTPARHARVFCCPQEMIVRVQSTGPEWKVEVQETAPREAATVALRHLYREHGKPAVKRHAPLRLYAGAKRYRLVGGAPGAAAENKQNKLWRAVKAVAVGRLLAAWPSLVQAPALDAHPTGRHQSVSYTQAATTTWTVRGDQVMITNCRPVTDCIPDGLCGGPATCTEKALKSAAWAPFLAYSMADGNKKVELSPVVSQTLEDLVADSKYVKDDAADKLQVLQGIARIVHDKSVTTTFRDAAREALNIIFEKALRDSITEFLAGVPKAGTEATAELDWETIQEWALNWGISDTDQEIGIYWPIVIRVAKEYQQLKLGKMPDAPAAEEARKMR